MDDNCTPKILRSTAKLPETPALERIGYGTGFFFNLCKFPIMLILLMT